VTILEGLIVVKKSFDYYVKDSESFTRGDLPLACKKFHAYRGFEGEPWPEWEYPEGTIPLDRLNEIVEYYREISNKNPDIRVDLIYLSDSKSNTDNPLVTDNFTFVGYDYGSFVSRWNYYSVLFHEVIFGVTELNKYSNFLNQNSLLSDRDIANSLEETRQRMLKEGFDLETAECLEEVPRIISISVYSHSESVR
jgi:hypothetical protein